MENIITKRAKNITLMCTLVYFASYLTRINFAVMMVKICADMNALKTELAVVVTGLTIVYGVGQVISGVIGDKIKPQYMLTSGLSLAAACNIAMFFCSTIPAMTVVWCINGFAQSMLWPPIVRIMSTYLADHEYSYAAVRVSWGSSIATILLYTCCPLLLKVMDWKTIMLLCAAVCVAIMIAWTLLNPKFLISANASTKSNEQNGDLQATVPVPKFVYLPIALIMLGIILQGTLRDGVTNWMPSYLCETFGLPEEESIISTVIQAVFSILSFWCFDFLHRKVFKNEVMCASVIFGGSALCSAALYFANILSASAAVSLVLMAVIIACMHGVNLMLISVVPKRFLRSGKVATYSGILNACTYIGASVATYGFAAIAENYGWNMTILTWIIISAAGIAVCLAAAPLWKKFRKEYADK
ncbi:MAG: MFS transporter [Ruminococcaceae bacterium]|nr:MFS transporter [Oscillospiraceae bacterium]